jgi:TonB family protein
MNQAVDVYKNLNARGVLKSGFSIGFALLCLSVQNAFSAPSAEPKVPPEPLASPGGWVTDNDYPVSAMADGIEGATAFTLTVALDGRVSDCLVTVSSGSESLDETACIILRQRARFKPALDSKAQPVVAPWASRIVWRIPDNPPKQASDFPKSLRLAIDVDEKGNVENCSVIASIGNPTFVPKLGRAIDPCESIIRGKRPMPVVDDQGRGIRARIEMANETQVTPR